MQSPYVGNNNELRQITGELENHRLPFLCHMAENRAECVQSEAG